MKQFLFVFLCSFISFTSVAQSSYELGILPSLNITNKLPKDWSLIFKAESRQSLVKDKLKYDYLLTDLSLAAAKKIGINTTISLGYLTRIEDESITNRLFQQLSFVKRYPIITLAHRLSADQSFEKGNSPEYRFRYRISAEFPMKGQSLDPKEFFIKLNNEYLNSFQGDEYDLEIRGAAFLGFVFSPATKLEIGLDYRADSFIEGSTRNRFWLGLNFFQSI